MAYSEETFLQLSGIQHFAFCRRQWALIHIEQLWSENLRTVEGNLFHKRAHDEQIREKRGNVLILRGLPVASSAMGLEEMLCCTIEEGALFYGETRRRVSVFFTKELREKVKEAADEMHWMFQWGHTPKVKPTKSCNACLCLCAARK